MDNFAIYCLLLIGIYVLYLSVKHITLECQKVIEYRYVPRSLEEEMKNPVKLSDVFKKMFDVQQPYQNRVGISIPRKP